MPFTVLYGDRYTRRQLRNFKSQFELKCEPQTHKKNIRTKMIVLWPRISRSIWFYMQIFSKARKKTAEKQCHLWLSNENVSHTNMLFFLSKYIGQYAYCAFICANMLRIRCILEEKWYIVIELNWRAREKKKPIRNASRLLQWMLHISTR